MFLQRILFTKLCKSVNYSSLAPTVNKITIDYTNQSSIQPKSCSWNIYTSIVLERGPVITRELNDLETKYNSFLQEYELENSKKSDHELREIEDENLLQKIRRGEIEQGNVQTAQDFEDLSITEYSKFIPALRRTDADLVNDTKSLNRALDSNLILLIKQKLGSDFKWICPQIQVNGNETLRQATDRLLKQTIPSIQTKIYGLAPFGYYKYKYPVRMTESGGVSGAKVFFYKAKYISGNMTTNSSNDELEYNDFTWAKRSEMKLLLNEKYFKSINSFLVPE